ncbi:MAG: protease modulator HflC [Clostridiales bacterium]|nr:protease modulator HflC [Clostridiales bacterium]
MNDFNNTQSAAEEQMKQVGRQAASALNRHKKPLIIIAVILAALALLWSECFFVVNEREQAVVSRFGVIKQVILNEESSFYERYSDQLQDEITMNGEVKIKKGSGLHFRIPFIDKVEKFSSMLYTYTSNSETINTSDKKQYNVTTYAQWRIAEPALFSLKLGNPRNAENQLDNLIHPVIVQAINRLTGDDFISNKEALNSALRQGLEHINRDMVIRGIQVQDIQVHRSILPAANVETTYDCMKADRAKVAQQLRSEGEQSYQMAVSDTDLRASIINADAVKEAGTVRAQADAEALSIYAEAYKVDPDFYTFWRSLQALQGTLKENSTLVLSQDHPLWQQLLKWGFGTGN